MKGWFRSDPLDEIVGLDTSYHGGYALASGKESFDPQAIGTLIQKKDELKSNTTNNVASVDHSLDDESRVFNT